MRSFITKLVLLIAAVYCVVTLVDLQGQIAEAEERRAQLSQELEAAELENLRLEDELARRDQASVEDIARSQLGLVSEGEILFYDSGN